MAPHDLRDVEKLLRQQSALANFGTFAYRESNLLTIMTEAARVCAQSLGVPFCKVCRYRPETDDLLVEAGVGWNPDVVGQVISKADVSSPQGRAFVTGKPVICEVLADEVGLRLPSFYADHGIVSTIDVIIKGNGTAYGVLEIDSPRQHTYDHHDVDFLTGFTNVLTEAVATSRRTAVLHATIEQMKALVAEKDNLLEEKKILAEELQHRVRNNLQLVLGMLSRQLAQSEDGPAKEGIGAIARRVMTLAQVYDHLLGSEMSRSIDFGKYLKSLCLSLQDLQRGQFPDVGVVCRVDEIILDLDAVTALGIVVAELVSNAYRHAFAEGKGTISISLDLAREGGRATLTVSDDGVGFHEAPESKRHGLGLVRRLAKQVGGTVNVQSDHGTNWTLMFPTSASPATA
ncbi:MAG: GAF domain-containing protein [Alphaproteobacteria bacterium]|nr:GAF domain-containing protein [Alphaproteobacteria bacterium]